MVPLSGFSYELGSVDWRFHLSCIAVMEGGLFPAIVYSMAI